MTRKTTCPRGFTLLESLLAIGLVGTIIAVSISLVDDVSSARRRVEASMRRVEGVTLAIDLLADRLATATSTAVDGGPGLGGEALSCRITGCGVASVRLAPASRRSPLLDRSTLELAWRDGGLAVRDDEGPWSMLATDLFAIRFRYHDGTDWRESWDGGRDGLPVAIELSIWETPWPEGLVAAWMPVPADVPDQARLEDEFAFDDPDSDWLGDFDDFEPDPVPAADDEVPTPDRRRVVAILDPVPPTPSEEMAP